MSPVNKSGILIRITHAMTKGNAHTSLGPIILLICNLIIFIGIVDKLLSAFERSVFPSKTAGKTWMDNYLKKVK